LFFIYSGTQISYENVCSYFLCSLVLRRLIYLDWFAKKFDHMKQLNAVVGILFILELYKTVVLMFICNFVTGEMNMNNRSCLQEQLPQQLFVDTLVQIANIDCCLLVTFK